MLSDNYDYKELETNKPLSAGFIFGYEAQKQYL